MKDISTNNSEIPALGANNISTNIWSILCVTYGAWRTESTFAQEKDSQL